MTIVSPGIWLDIRMVSPVKPRPALFLDRDGIINRDTGFLTDPADVVLVPETAALIKIANDAHVPVLVVTNQSGIDRGVLDWNRLAAVETRIAELLAKQGAVTDATAACPFHPDHTDSFDERHAAWRKPGPAMITALADRLNIDRAASWMIGDKPRDIEAACNACLAGGILVGRAEYPDKPARPGFSTHVVRSTGEAMPILSKTALFDGH